MGIKIHKVKEKDGCLGMESIESWYVPNWYNKGHFEDFMGRKLTTKQFRLLKHRASEDLMDHISNEVREYLVEEGDKILEEADD